MKTTTMKINARTPLATIRAALLADGFGHCEPAKVRAAAVAGALLWTKERLTTTDVSRYDERPQCWTPTPDREAGLP